MKKILLASSALAMTASVAAAEVSVGGDAYYGILYSDTDLFINASTGKKKKYSFAFDLDIDFTATGTSDSGLVFGASIDADDTAKAQGPVGFDGEVFIAGEFGRLAMGDTDGAAEEVIGDLDAVSLSGLFDANENIFLLSAGDPDCEQALDANGDPIPATSPVVLPDGTIEQVPNGDFVTDGECGQGPLALYTYNFQGFTGAVGLNDDEGWSVGAGYDGGNWTVGVAYEQVRRGTLITLIDSDFGTLTERATETATQVIGEASFTFANTTIKGTYGQINTGEGQVTAQNGQVLQPFFRDSKYDQRGISVETSFDALALAAFYREIDNNIDGLKRSYFWGFGASYDLGGGLAVVAGVQQAVIYDGVSDGGPIGTPTFSSNNDKQDGYLADFGLDFAF